MRLLIIEDNEDLCQLLREGFEELGHEVDTAGDGRNGLDLIRSGKYDCVILDIMLPEMDGFEVMDQVRDEGHDVPVIMLTAKDSVEDRVHGLEQGADDYLTKPFDFKELMARVNALMRRSGDQRRSILKCGPLTLDPVARECRVGDIKVPLRRREFDILELLMRYENQVFSRDKIIAQVWQKEYDGTSNVVDVHIKYLRDKLRPFNLDMMVVTVRGVGYKVANPEGE
ncbi:response regulator transcription factor [Thermanaerovibrio acidaminovorans]|jgi:two-component system copper resistance phosphate regulon response regulator CusR|uniref:Two component transcriptional regulator, winged helix family n=1 Tax=Thermanaerovibrio acidaminovorans (strain ATCC 49978 / DSM 6589 / Su883) TaxID=525903 RepID=D1B9J7_THEAS|nr:response regulator transcription factor [Thermanaerovibrio acidaminovorans]ACZ18950.1 two component transcriptional regulator, winged helix family [Thermanaerovibrio acidaminovorans DSM 6589]